MNAIIGPFPVWAEVDLEAIAHNLSIVKLLVKPSTAIMAVVKANAYGHGAVAVARTAIECGASTLGVARISEAISLRQAGITQPILIFGYTPPALAAVLIEYNLTQTVSSLPYAKELNHHAHHAGGQITIHLKIDTGMGRLGFATYQPEDNSAEAQVLVANFIDQISQLCNCDNLLREGAYTHFAASDSSDKSSANKQLDLFKRNLVLLEAENIRFSIQHAANSGAVCDLPEAHLDMVRPGVMLYGLYPSDEVRRDTIELKPAMQIKAKIAQVKDVPKDFSVSYGHTYITSKATRLATVPIGYGDGFNRRLSSSGAMLVRGQRAPVIGRVCMDQTIIDVGHIKGVCTDDEVTVLGQQGDEIISADEIAHLLETINYEVVTSLMSRVPRVTV